MGQRWDHRRSPPHRGSPHGAWRRSYRQRKRKIQLLTGVKGACPLGLPPHWGREGFTLTISHANSKN
jgi:hypothetical protein